MSDDEALLDDAAVPALSPSLASEMEDAPPAVQPDRVPAQTLTDHPVWMNSRQDSPMVHGNRGSRNPWNQHRRGRRGGRSSSENGDGAERPRYERISLTALELGANAEMDGADSHLNSDDSDDDLRRVRPRARREAAPRGPRNEGEGYDEAEFSEQESEGGFAHRPRGSADDMMAEAAFGGGGGRPYGPSDDGHSETSSKRRRDAYKEAFPVRGVACVGCAIATRIAPVERFIQTNIGRMTEDSLWKMAALTYKREVAEPCEREGVVVPKWSWKEIQMHYCYHSTSNNVGRHQMIRQLQMLRAQAETRLVRVDNGERELDRGGAELMLKILAAESRERQLLESKPGGKSVGSSVVTNAQ